MLARLSAVETHLHPPEELSGASADASPQHGFETAQVAHRPPYVHRRDVLTYPELQPSRSVFLSSSWCCALRNFGVF